MPIAKLKNTNTYYEVHGAGEPLVLIHGLSGNASAWTLLMPYLEKHFQVICYDMRGSGQTRFNDKAFNISDLADDLAELLDFLGMNKAHILGHSMGGIIAQDFAARYLEKINRLILLHTRIQNTFVTQRFWEGLIHLRKKYNIPQQELVELGAFWSFSPTFLANAENIKMLKEWAAAYAYPQSVENFELQANALKMFDGRPLTPKLSMPTLIVSGSEDILTPAQAMRDLAGTLPQTIYVEQKGGAHCSTIEAPEWLAKELYGFLQDAEAGAK